MQKARVQQYDDFAAAQKAASWSNKTILLVITRSGEDTYSTRLENAVLNTKKFISFIKKQSVVVRLDFSDSSYARTTVHENASPATQAAAERAAAQWEKNLVTVKNFRINTRESPVVLLATKEGYFITDIPIDASFLSPDAFIAAVAHTNAQATALNYKIALVEQSSGQQKIRAIDDLYDAMPAKYQHQLDPLCREVIRLDTQNKTGLFGKYVGALAYSHAADLLLDGRYDEASGVFETLAEYEQLNDIQRMQAYYAAAHVLGRAETRNYKKIIALLTKALESVSDKNSTDALQIASELQMINEVYAAERARELHPDTHE